MSKKKTSVFRRRKNKAETSSASSENTAQSAPASSVGNTVDQLKFVEPIDVTDVAREKTDRMGTASTTVAPAPKKRQRSSTSSRRKGKSAKPASAQGASSVPPPETMQEAQPAQRASSESARAKASRRSGRAEPRSTAQRAPKHDDPPSESPATSTDARHMLINVSAGDECRIAVTLGGRLEELFIERTASQSHVGNIYKGRVTNLEPSIQAAFVDFGLQQNGFLHISDVQPQYFPNHKGVSESVGKKIPRHSRPPIQKCFRRGQEVIVQVIKEGVGTKGPTLTTYLSIPGRFLVMMPGMSRHGVSRKIEDDQDRQTMRALLKELELPSDMGFILRTAGLDRSKRELQRDLNYLTRLWKAVAERIKKQPSPAELYQESDLVIRTLRDVYTADFSRLLVDDPDTQRKAQEFLHIAMPRTKVVVELFEGSEPLFHRFGIEAEIENISMRHVPLRSGGSIVIDQTEALVAIDVNSGRYRPNSDAEEAAFQINMEAAEEIARQLRLRDLGGLIVCDFIDMRLDKHCRAVERTIRDALKKHKERARILRMSAFGLIEMTRQRRGPALNRSYFADCPQCQGTGHVRMPDSVMLDVMRLIQLAVNHPKVARVQVTASNAVAFALLNNKRKTLAALEATAGKSIEICGSDQFATDRVEYVCEDARGQKLDVLPDQTQASVGKRSTPARRMP